MKKHILTAGLLVTFLILCGMFVTWVSADNTLADLEEQKALLELRIEQGKQEYAKISSQRESYQQFCNLRDEAEKQMLSLNQLNNSRREEITLIDQKIAAFQESLSSP